MYFDTPYLNTTIWNETTEKYLCGHSRKEKSVGIYPSVLFYFHVRREIEGAGGGNPQTFPLFYYFLSGMRSYLRHIKYEKPFRKLLFKMLTINRYHSMVFSVTLSLYEPRFSTPFLQNDPRIPMTTVFSYVTVIWSLTACSRIEADPNGRSL